MGAVLQGRNEFAPWVPEGQNESRQGATRPLEACLGATRPEYFAPGAHMAKYWQRAGYV